MVVMNFSIIGYLEGMDYNMRILDNEISDINIDIAHIRGSLQCEDPTIVNPTHTGNYFYPADTIKIYINGRDFKSVSRTFIHEWGHHLWWEELDKEQRTEFCNLNFNKYVSEYAKESCEENFAETYKYFALNLTIPEPQKSWMEKNLNGL